MQNEAVSCLFGEMVADFVANKIGMPFNPQNRTEQLTMRCRALCTAMVQVSSRKGLGSEAWHFWRVDTT